MKKIIYFLLFILSINLYSQSEPSWINNYPTDNNYYTGIGSSNSGNKSEDYERALIQARLNLASEISTSIKAETEIITTDSTDRGLNESFKEKINQSVEQYLKELEIVDSYYSGNQGYWIYLRLNKNRWKEIQQNEMNELLSRIQQILDGDYFSNSLTTSDRLYKLASATTILDESPYNGILSGKIGVFYNGNVYDFLQSEIYRITSDISIIVDNSSIIIESGETIDIRVNCKSSDYYIGKLPLTLYIRNDVASESYTDISGLSRIRLESNIFNEGSNKLVIKIEPQTIGFPESYNNSEIFLIGSEEISLNLLSSSLYLSIVTNRPELTFLNDPVGSLFTKGNENFKISEDRNSSRFELIISLNFSEYPKVLDNAPLMAGLDCIITLKQENRVLYEFKNDTLKDGGLTYEQAFRRVFNKLIRILEQERSYISEIENQISK